MKKMPNDKKRLRLEKKIKEASLKEELKKKELELRRLKRKADAKACRERAKEREGQMQQKLTELQEQKNALLEENKTLIRKKVELLQENSSLKIREKSMSNVPVKKENSDKPDAIRSLFVSIPLFKLEKSQYASQSDGIDVVHNMGSKHSSCKCLSESSLVKWLDNFEKDCKNDRLFSLSNSNLLSCEINKHCQAFRERVLEKQDPEGRPENTQLVDDSFESRVINELKANFMSADRKSPFIHNETYTNIMSNNAEVNRNFFDPVREWTFDDLYED